MQKYLSLKWGISKGRDTYGYNIVTLTDTTTGKKYRTMGGGYDMTGTVFGDWLQATEQPALLKIKRKAPMKWDGKNHDRRAEKIKNTLYGMTHYTAATDKGERIVLDGACGLECMLTIAKAIGLDVQQVYDRSKRTHERIGFNIITKE